MRPPALSAGLRRSQSELLVPLFAQSIDESRRKIDHPSRSFRLRKAVGRCLALPSRLTDIKKVGVEVDVLPAKPECFSEP
jgi:hypothetical protein